MNELSKIKDKVSHIHVTCQVFKALMIGMVISSKDVCYRKIDNLLAIKLRNITKNEDHWAEYPFDFCIIQQIANDMTDEEYSIMCANISLNELHHKKY